MYLDHNHLNFRCFDNGAALRQDILASRGVANGVAGG